MTHERAESGKVQIADPQIRVKKEERRDQKADFSTTQSRRPLHQAPRVKHQSCGAKANEGRPNCPHRKMYFSQQPIKGSEALDVPSRHSSAYTQNRRVCKRFFRAQSSVQAAINGKNPGALERYVIDIPNVHRGLNNGIKLQNAKANDGQQDDRRTNEERETPS